MSETQKMRDSIVCPNHEQAYIYNFVNRLSYCAYCGEPVPREEA
jgi:hypothetical protein